MLFDASANRDEDQDERDEPSDDELDAETAAAANVVTDEDMGLITKLTLLGTKHGGFFKIPLFLLTDQEKDRAGQLVELGVL